ncbi:rod shape-determining protein MreC [Rickettsiales bacterium LUAb2]
MAKIHNVNRFNFLKWLIALCIAMYILSLNITNNNFITMVSFKINHSIYKVYSFFYSLPLNYKTYTANKNLIINLRDQNQDLQNQISELKQNQSIVTYLQKQNSELSKKLNLIDNSPYNINKVITTLIDFKSISPNTSTFNLAIGSNNNINNNNPVIADNNLIGRIFNLTKNTSQVMLITNINSRVPVYTENTNIDAILIGNNSLTPNIISYEKNVNFIEGEKVYTSGLGGIFPRNIPIGVITKDNNNWIVKLDANLYNISYVHIILLKNK